ncbi:flavin reductase family protein [Alteromonas gracilis]
MSRRELRPSYPLLTALVVPRPIAWVSTLDADGVGNLAPHSFFSVASTKPPAVMFTSVGRKDTLRNIEATGEFVVNLASAPHLSAINGSSASVDPDVDEADLVGVAMEPSETVAPPRVTDSPAALECRLDRIVEVGDCFVVIGEVTSVSVREEVLDGDHPRFGDLMPLSRLGKEEWGLPPEVVEVPRPR